MKKVFIMLFILVVCLQISTLGESQDSKEKLVNKLNYRQKEFYNQWKYLSNREREIAGELNRGINSYNQNPSAKALQKIEDLKIKIIENLQDQLRSGRDYIAYLEPKLSELLDYKFTALRFREDIDEIKEAAEELLLEDTPLKIEEEADEIKETAKKLLKEASQRRR
ncbi:MAG: hypothetical protein KAU58_00830 [Candidatus Omnitrophica bacterium]|nr:hypothetical protein [Candidatus Omnitrophota bacterium]